MPQTFSLGLLMKNQHFLSRDLNAKSKDKEDRIGVSDSKKNFKRAKEVLAAETEAQLSCR
jgi:RNase P protein component